jgi:hypothetical protein
MTIRRSLDDLCPGTLYSLSNTTVLVGKPLQYQAPVASPLSTTRTIGANLPTPPSILTVKHQEKGIVRLYLL